MKLVSVIFLLVLAAPLHVIQSDAGEPAATRRSLVEGNRVLEEEIKLASRPHIYLLLNLPEKVIVVKGRGIELHRLPVITWRLAHEGQLDRVFHLRIRPPVMRPKAAPTTDDVPPVIELKDMPQAYDLIFDPGLTMTIAPAAEEQPWLWAKSLAKEWWTRLASWVPFAGDRDQTAGAHVHLTLSENAAQSLAWVMTDDMALIITHP